MMQSSIRLLGMVAAIATCAVSIDAQGKIKWETDFQAALTKAKTANQPILACFSMQGERVCDVIIAEHYTDPKLVELSQQTVNLFCSPHGTDAQKELEKRVRIDLLKGDTSTWMVAPQHVVFMPDGTLIWAVPYYITAGELEWMLVEATRKVKPKFEWEATDRYRAPRSLAAKITAATVKQAPPPTHAEVKAILKEIKRGYGGYYGAKDKLPIIVRNDGSKAKTFVDRLLRSRDSSIRERIETLSIIAANASRSWWSVAKGMLEDDAHDVRHAAVDTLRQLGEKRATKVLLGRWRKEESVRVRGAILQALVACGPSNSQVIKIVPGVLTGEKDEALRVQAVIAIASLDSKKTVHAALTAALVDTSERVRSTAAWAVASRRDTELLDVLKAALTNERHKDAEKWLTLACAVLAGGELGAFAEFPELKNR
ncbi:MAG: hypothetical protein ACI85K_002594 [Hyphomicrobiaceae bacterium]|jgi:hypothetical protein